MSELQVIEFNCIFFPVVSMGCQVSKRGIQNQIYVFMAKKQPYSKKFISFCEYIWYKLLISYSFINEPYDIVYKQYHLISTKYLTFHSLKSISTGFWKLKDQKMEITFTLIRKFTVCTMAKTELLYLKNVEA